jgi:type I restriction enzyme, S subunit
VIKIKPKLRFKSFHGEWIQEKISEVAIINPKNKLNEDFYYIDLDSVKNGQIKNYRIENKDSAPSRAQRVAEINDIFYQTVRPYQKNNVIFDIKSNNQFVFSSGYAQLRINNDIDFKMIYQITLTHKFTTKVLNLCTGTSYPAVNANDLGNINISIPEKIEEQQKIGAFFSKLDQLIDLQAHKIDQLQRLKRGYLQKLFPQPGESVPRLRFKGFTDEWKEKKLDDLGNTYSGLSGKSKDDFGHGNAEYVTYKNVYNNPILSPNQNDKIDIDDKQNQVKKGDIFFTTSSETPDEVGMPSVIDYSKDNLYLNSFTFGYRPNVQFDNYFIAYLFRTNEFRKVIYPLAQGISRYNLSKKSFMKIKISLPGEEEQQKIGDFFKRMDNNIELQNKKLDELKQLKKAYLQKIFI